VEVGVWLQFAELMEEIRAQGLSKIIPEASLFKATETEGLHRRWGRFHRELPGRRHDGGYFVGSGGVWGLSRPGPGNPSELPNRGRRVRVWLTAIPMGASANSVAAPFGAQIRAAEPQFH
jgi:hypothetical protein